MIERDEKSAAKHVWFDIGLLAIDHTPLLLQALPPKKNRLWNVVQVKNEKQPEEEVLGPDTVASKKLGLG